MVTMTIRSCHKILILFAWTQCLPKRARAEYSAATCDAPAVERGSPANITCHFDSDIGRTRNPFGIDKYHAGTPQVVLRCHWSDKSAVPLCSYIPGYSFDLMDTRIVTLQILSATEEFAGTYACHELGSDQQNFVSCNLELLSILTDVPESAAVDGFKPVIVSEADTSFILHTQSSMIPDHPGEESFHVSTEGDTDDVKISFSSRASTSVAADPQYVLVVTMTNDVPGDHVPFMYGVDFMVVTSIGILASAAVIITVSIVCVRKGRRRCKHRADEADQPVQRIDLMRPDQNERDGENDGRRFSQESNFYWEVRDDPPTPSPELPRPCRWPALSDDYLHPTVSHGVVEGTDDAVKMTPLYENSVLRKLDTLGNIGDSLAKPDLVENTSPKDLQSCSKRAPTAALLVGSSEKSVVVCTVELHQRQVAVKELDDQTEDSEYGYMPMTGTVRRIATATSQASMEVTDGAAEPPDMLDENSTAMSNKLELPNSDLASNENNSSSASP